MSRFAAVGLWFVMISIASAQEVVVDSLNDPARARITSAGRGMNPTVTMVDGDGRTTDGDGSLLLAAQSQVAEGSQYVTVTVTLPAPLDLTDRRLLLDARTDHPEQTRAFYVRAYNAGATAAAWSFMSWDAQLTAEWRTFRMIGGESHTGLRWEESMSTGGAPTQIDRLQVIFGTREHNVPISLQVDNLRTSPARRALPEGDSLVHPLDSIDGVSQTWGFAGAVTSLTVAGGDGNTTDGNGAVRLEATGTDRDGSQYFGLMIPLGEPFDLTGHGLQLDVRSDHPETTGAFYIRLYNSGDREPCSSFASWSNLLRTEWQTFHFQQGYTDSGGAFEDHVVGDRKPTNVDRLEILIGTRDKNATVSVLADRLMAVPERATLSSITEPRQLVRRTVLVSGGQPRAVILTPASEAGRAAGQAVSELIKAATGVALSARPATAADRECADNAIILGNVFTNDGLRLLYSRNMVATDYVCPGPGGAVVQTVHDPFGKGNNLVVLGASDETGLTRAVELFGEVAGGAAATGELAFDQPVHRAEYSEEFARRYRAALGEAAANHLEQGLAAGQRDLDTGRHTSIAGRLRSVAGDYLLSRRSADAKLFVALWDLYASSAVADPRKYGGPWGFDSDFPSFQVVTGWDNIEEDPSLTDEERLRTTLNMIRWLREAVVRKVQPYGFQNVAHNHNTFPGLGTMAAGLYLSAAYDVVEAKQWLRQADWMFVQQSQRKKAHEDCNGYQWLTFGHTMQYAMARPDNTVFDTGTAQWWADFCIGNMDNLNWQVPYGDTGNWKCWNSELLVLDIVGMVTGDPATRWAADYKRRTRGLWQYGQFMALPEELEPPTRFNGVQVFELEPAYYTSHKEPGWQPPVEACFDKISFREAMDPQAPYLLLDGLSNGGHKHLDGNSIPRITQFDRIWLADNDYFKTQVKYHNSMLVFKDGQSGEIPGYTELIGAGESGRYGYSRSRLAEYAGVDWERAIVWLKAEQAFVVLDRVTAREADDYQFRLMWHGVGEVDFDEKHGMLLRQGGPSMRVQVMQGPELRLFNDEELGTNWAGYPHAPQVVRSMSSIATVRLDAGQSYLFATAIHGRQDGDQPLWRMALVDGLEGVLVETERGRYGVGLGPLTVQEAQGEFDTDADIMVLDEQGLSLLNATRARLMGLDLHLTERRSSVDLPFPQASEVLAAAPLRRPVANLPRGGDAPAHPVLWSAQPKPERLVLTGNQGVPGAVDLGLQVTSEPGPAPRNVFSADSPNHVKALTDGNWASNTATSVMYDPDQTVTLTFDLGSECGLSQVEWHQWYSRSSSQNTRYLLKQATVLASSDNFAADSRQLGIVTDDRQHPNFGTPIHYTVDANGQRARWVRLVIEPQPGSAVYLAEVLISGEPSSAVDIGGFVPTRIITARLRADSSQPESVMATDQGVLKALTASGETVFTQDFRCRLNDVLAVDLNGDGIDELVVARHDYHVTVLAADGSVLWSRELAYYRRNPTVNLVRAGDIDGDGRPEIIAGSDNWRFYAFTADGTELWNYEAVHPARSGAVADLDGDGKDEVLCGTHYYTAWALGADGTRRWGYRLGPICYDIATGSFDGDRTRGVIFAGGDGFIHYADSAGQARMKYHTGDEVKRVATIDLTGDGKDEILGGSSNWSVYCFNAAAERLWRTDLGGVISALRPVAAARAVVAASEDGMVVTLGPDGTWLAATDLAAGVVDVAIDGETALVATTDGWLRRLAIREK